jgi:hypothetical protein
MLLMGCSLLPASPLLATSAPPDHVPEIPLVLVQRSNLSGTWSGTETLTAIGSCILQGEDSITKAVRMQWQVDDDGSVNITLPEWPGVYPYTFKGQISPELDLSAELASKAKCSGIERPFSATYESAIQVEGGLIKIDMQATEVWCPGTCIFTRQFVVQRAMPGP